MTGVAATLRSAVPLVTERVADRVFVVLAGWLMTGVFLDAWAHISGLPDSFWTPWHGVLYSGLAACGAALALAKLAERAAGRAVLGAGYGLSLVGFGIGALGGVGDAVWHSVFGVEFDIEAAVSPSHLAIAAGILLVVTGPARAEWSRRSFGLAGALSLLYGLSILAIILDYANPFARVAGTAGAADQGMALFAFTLYGALLSGTALVALRHAPVGAHHLALIVGGNAVAMVLVNGPILDGHSGLMLAVALASALAAGAAAAWLRPGPARPGATRAFAFALPFSVFVVYAVAVNVATQTSWTPTFWSGLVAMGALAGLLLSAVAAPAGGR